MNGTGIGIIDNQVTIIENGVRATSHMNSNTSIPERRLYLCGTRGTLRADLYTGKIELRRIVFDQELEEHSMKGAGMHGGGDEILARQLIATMIHDEPTSTNLDGGLLAAVTCFAIDDAMDSGRIVDMASYWDKVDSVPGPA